MSAALELQGLEVRYGSVPAVRNLTLEVGEGEIVGLIGPNGAGQVDDAARDHGHRSLRTPATLSVRGESIRKRSPETVARSGIALVPEGRRIYPHMTVEENLRLGFAGRRGRDGVEADLQWVRELFPIVADMRGRQAGSLSGGQQQQLAIARALVARPDLLLLDEPSLGLAPVVVDVVFEALGAIRERGVTVLLVEQRAQRTVAFADRSHVLSSGELVTTFLPKDAGDTARMVEAYLPMSTVQNLIDACALGSVYALMAVGIGLVFGVLRIVNFAYGQLIMAGAYTLALTNGWNPALSIAMCFVIVIGLSILMDVVVFRPLRGAEPATMLIATFAVSLLLYYIALLRFTVLGKTVGTLTGLNRPIGDGTLLVRWIWVVDMIVALGALAGLLALLNRTNLGLHMRAAAADFRTARMLGVRANPTIMVAVILSGVLAAVVAVLMTAETPYVTPDYALRDTIVVLVGVRRRRDGPAVDRGARRLLDRLRHVVHGGKAADLRPGSTRNTSTPSSSAWSSSRCSCARTASSSGAGAAPWSAYEALARPARRPGRADRARRILGQLPLQRTRDRVRARAGVHGDRGRALRLHRQLRRDLVRPDRVLPGRRVRRRASSRSRPRRSRASSRTSTG